MVDYETAWAETKIRAVNRMRYFDALPTSLRRAVDECPTFITTELVASAIQDARWEGWSRQKAIRYAIQCVADHNRGIVPLTPRRQPRRRTPDGLKLAPAVVTFLPR